MNHYSQLTQEQRYHISGLLKAGKFQIHIAGEVGVHKSTISREVRRNRGDRGYLPKQARQRALNNRQQAEKYIKFTPELKKFVAEKISLDWSSDQISGYLQKEWVPSQTLAHASLYYKRISAGHNYAASE